MSAVLSFCNSLYVCLLNHRSELGMGCDRETEPRCCDVRLTSARARVLNLLNLKTHREHFIRVRFSHLRVCLANFQLFWTWFFRGFIRIGRLVVFWPIFLKRVIRHRFQTSCVKHKDPMMPCRFHLISIL